MVDNLKNKQFDIFRSPRTGGKAVSLCDVFARVAFDRSGLENPWHGAAVSARVEAAGFEGFDGLGRTRMGRRESLGGPCGRRSHFSSSCGKIRTRRKSDGVGGRGVSDVVIYVGGRKSLLRTS